MFPKGETLHCLKVSNCPIVYDLLGEFDLAIYAAELHVYGNDDLRRYKYLLS